MKQPKASHITCAAGVENRRGLLVVSRDERARENMRTYVTSGEYKGEYRVCKEGSETGRKGRVEHSKNDMGCMLTIHRAQSGGVKTPTPRVLYSGEEPTSD